MTDQLDQPPPHVPTRQDFVRHLVSDGFGPTTADRIAATAERAGIVWCQEPQRPSIIAEIRDPTGARQVVHALEERAKDEIRKLIQDEISVFDRQSLTPRLKNVDSRTEAAIESANSAHTFLRGHDARITALERQTAGLETHRDWVLGTLTVRVTELGARLSELKAAVGGFDLDNFDPEDDDTISERLSDLEGRLDHQDRRNAKIEAAHDARITSIENAEPHVLARRIARVESEWQIEGRKLAADRRQLRAFVVDTVGRTDAAVAELKSRVDTVDSRSYDDWASLRGTVNLIWKWLAEDATAVTSESDHGFIGLMRRLDADVALLRDAAVLPPPQCAAPDEPAQISVDDPAYRERIERNRFEFPDMVRRAGSSLISYGEAPAVEWPDPTPEMLESPVFEAIWQVIRTWDVAVPGAYTGYTSATGNHVRAILDGVGCLFPSSPGSIVDRLGRYAEHIRQTREALRAVSEELGVDSQWSDATSLADVVSEVLMPAVRKPRSTTDELIQALRGFSGPEIWHAMGIVRQVEVSVGDRICGVSPASLWNGSTVKAQDDLLDYLWRNHWNRLGDVATRHGIFCGEAATNVDDVPF